jgi:hypothetical protein
MSRKVWAKKGTKETHEDLSQHVAAFIPEYEGRYESKDSENAISVAVKFARINRTSFAIMRLVSHICSVIFSTRFANVE